MDCSTRFAMQKQIDCLPFYQQTIYNEEATPCNRHQIVLSGRMLLCSASFSLQFPSGRNRTPYCSLCPSQTFFRRVSVQTRGQRTFPPYHLELCSKTAPV